MARPKSHVNALSHCGNFSSFSRLLCEMLKTEELASGCNSASALTINEGKSFLLQKVPLSEQIAVAFRSAVASERLLNYLFLSKCCSETKEQVKISTVAVVHSWEFRALIARRKEVLKKTKFPFIKR